MEHRHKYQALQNIHTHHAAPHLIPTAPAYQSQSGTIRNCATGHGRYGTSSHQKTYPPAPLRQILTPFGCTTPSVTSRSRLSLSWTNQSTVGIYPGPQDVNVACHSSAANDSVETPGRNIRFQSPHCSGLGPLMFGILCTDRSSAMRPRPPRTGVC